MSRLQLVSSSNYSTCKLEIFFRWCYSRSNYTETLHRKVENNTGIHGYTSTIGTCSLVISVLFPVQPLYYVPYKTLILRLEAPGTRLVQQAQHVERTTTKKPFNRLLQNLGNERRYIFKDPHQDSGWCNFSCAKYSGNVLPKCIARTFYGDAMLVSLWEAPTWLTETTRNICYQFCNESVNLSLEELTQSKDCPQNKLLFLTYMKNSSLGRHLNAVRNSSVLYHKRGPARGWVLCRPSEF